MEENMKGKSTNRKRKKDNRPDAIDKLETIASTAYKVYRVVKPVAKAILDRKKSNYEARHLPRQKTILR